MLIKLKVDSSSTYFIELFKMLNFLKIPTQQILSFKEAHKKNHEDCRNFVGMLVSLYLDYYIFSPRHMLDAGEKCDAKCEVVLFCSFLFFFLHSLALYWIFTHFRIRLNVALKWECGVVWMRWRGRSEKLLFFAESKVTFSVWLLVFFH